MGYKERPKEEGEIGWEPKARNAMFFGGFFLSPESWKIIFLVVNKSC